MPASTKVRKPTAKHVDHLMMSLEASDRMRRGKEEVWRECLENYMVVPYGGGVWNYSSKQFPLAGGSQYSGRSGFGDYAILKDSESHQIVETLLAMFLSESLSGENYILARRVGVEDTYKAGTATRLLEYDYSLEGQYRKLYLWAKHGLLVGTGTVGQSWRYYASPRRQRSLEVDPYTGDEIISESGGMTIECDDPELRNIDPFDFWPAAARFTGMKDMPYGIERIRLTARTARRLVEQGYLDGPSTEKAIVNAKALTGRMGVIDALDREDQDWREGLDLPEDADLPDEFTPLVGYCYSGEIPWERDDSEEAWGVITVIAGEGCGFMPWNLPRRRLGFYDFTVTPMAGSYWGLSPLEVSRFDQDAVDVLKSLTIDAARRTALPPFEVREGGVVNKNDLKRFHMDRPIVSRDGDSVKQIPYSAPIERLGALAQSMKGSMRERTGALDVNQGLPFGTKRLSGTEAALQGRAAGLRPGALAEFAERDALPPLGRGALELYQDVLVSSDEVTMRIGERPEAVPLASILTEYDLRFVGSARVKDREQRLSALERATAQIGALPISARFPWGLWLGQYLRELDQPELEAAVDDPQEVRTNLLVQMLSGAGGGAPAANGNGQFSAPQDAGRLPAQEAGRALGGA